MVFRPQAWPFLRSVLGPQTVCQSGCQDQARARIGELDTVARRLLDVEEEGLLDRVLVRPGLDDHAVLKENIGGLQHVLALIDRIGHVVEPAFRTVCPPCRRHRKSCC